MRRLSTSERSVPSWSMEQDGGVRASLLRDGWTVIHDPAWAKNWRNAGRKTARQDGTLTRWWGDSVFVDRAGHAGHATGASQRVWWASVGEGASPAAMTRPARPARRTWPTAKTCAMLVRRQAATHRAPWYGTLRSSGAGSFARLVQPG